MIKKLVYIMGIYALMIGSVITIGAYIKDIDFGLMAQLVVIVGLFIVLFGVISLWICHKDGVKYKNLSLDVKTNEFVLQLHLSKKNLFVFLLIFLILSTSLAGYLLLSMEPVNRLNAVVVPQVRDTILAFSNVIFGGGVSAANWSTKSTMAHAVADVPCVIYNEKLYCFGGSSNFDVGPNNYTQEYDPLTDSWTNKTNIPTARWGASAAEYAGKIYVFGGTIDPSEGNIVKNECYNVSNDSWSTMTDVPSEIGHQGLMAVTVGSKIYLFYKTYCYEYSTSSDSYTQKANSTKSVTWATCAVVNNEVYLIGGYDYGTNAGTNIVRKYNISADSWNDSYDTAPYFAWGTTRDNPVINDKIYYGFGQHPLDTYHKKMYEYEPFGKTWTKLPDAVYARDGVGCGVINNKLYVVGGRADSVGFDYNEELEFNLTGGTVY